MYPVGKARAQLSKLATADLKHWIHTIETDVANVGDHKSIEFRVVLARDPSDGMYYRSLITSVNGKRWR
jgi:hypothetical protein